MYIKSKLLLPILCWLSIMFGAQPATTQVSIMPSGINPLTDICTNCPDPAPQPPVPLTTPLMLTFIYSNPPELSNVWTGILESTDCVSWQVLTQWNAGSSVSNIYAQPFPSPMRSCISETSTGGQSFESQVLHLVDSCLACAVWHCTRTEFEREQFRGNE